MKNLLLLTAVLLLCGTAFAQSPHICATDSILKSDTNYTARSAAFAAELAEFSAKTPASSGYTYYGSTINSITAGCDSAVYIIPVVVHIDTSGGTVNVTDTQVFQQIVILNNRFAPYRIRFVLAKRQPNGTSFTGINRFGGSFDYRFDKLAASFAASSTHYYDPEKYFNIYVAPQILNSDGNPSTINGFDQRFPNHPPGPDLVVVLYSKFGDFGTCSGGCGTLNSNSKGLVLVHEAGHYLGLRELFEEGCGGGNTANTCASAGDLCCDTRPVTDNRSCPVVVNNNCSYHLSINDNYANYMSYAGESCQDNFTADQVSLMRASLELYRNQLISPQNINTLDLTDCFTSAWFDAENNFICDSGDFTLHAIAYTGAVSYRWLIDDGFNNLVDTTIAIDSFTWHYTNVGTYNVILQIINVNNDTAFVARFNYLQIADCGTTIANEQGNWYFGDAAGLRFTAGGAVRDIEPSQIGPNINTAEGTISHSNNNGQLLFYAGGNYLNPGYLEIYNRNYRPMPNSPIYGDFSACQAGAVVQMPNDTNKYYLFTVSTNDALPLEGFRYSIIDMTLNGGLGDIVSASKNTPIKGPAGLLHSTIDSALLISEQITVIPKCGNQEYWVLVLNYDGNLPYEMSIILFELDNTGLHYFGKTANLGYNSGGGVGQLKASPNGNWLYLWGKLFKFNKNTGDIIVYRDSLAAPTDVSASFSPNSELLYTGEAQNANSTFIYQYDLQSFNDSLSRTLVTIFPITSNLFQMQLGPDEKIYISKFGHASLAVINAPDSNINNKQPTAPQYTLNGAVLSNNGVGGQCLGGLPNMRDAKFPTQIPLDFAVIDSACGNVTFLPNTPCASSYLWNFGDGDTSTQREPKHIYTDTGSYTVTLTINGSTIKQKTIVIGIPSKISGDSISCVFDNGTVGYSISNRNDECTYTWGVTGGSYSVDPSNNIFVSWSGDSGLITLNAINPNNGCIMSDTLEVLVNYIDSNTIWVDTGSCFLGNVIDLYGNITTSTLGNVVYQWQSSVDGITWSNTGIGDTLQNFTDTVQDSVVWYRRVAKQGDCSFSSPAIKISPQLYIKRHPEDYVACFNGWGMFFVEIVKPAGMTVTPVWQYQFKGTSWWSAEINIGDTTRKVVNSSYDSAKFRCTITTPCGTIVSNTAYIFVRPEPAFTTHPQSHSVNEGNNTLFIAKGNLQVPESYQWFCSWDNGTTWDSIPNEHDDTLIISNVTRCLNGYLYKAKYFTECSPYSWPVFSNSATLTVNQTLNFDLWARDGVNDTGVEPNTPTANDYWGSPDLWNCWMNGGNCNAHETIEYMNFGQNTARFRVYNKGMSTSPPFEVKLYWTLGGFYEKWPLSWHYDLVNNGYWTPLYGTQPMGKEIGTDSHTGLAGGASTIFNMGWNPPNPAWYYTSKEFSSGRLSHPICILARIVTCPDPAYGMTIPEIEPTGDNVINNNNIVTRNTDVYDSIGSNRTTPEYVLTVGNQWEIQRAIKFTIGNSVNNFWDLGYYVLKFDANIHAAWTAGGSNGSGYTLDPADSIFYVYDDGFYLDSILLDSSEWGWVHIQFRLHDEVEITENRGEQLFEFVQYSYDAEASEYTADGGFNFLLNLLPPPPPHVDSLEFSISPNPTSPGNVTVSMTSNFSSTGVVINVYDGLGNPVISQHSVGTISPGNQSTIVNLSGVASGAYNMVITANGIDYNEIVIVL
ncbi:MAG TPA: PKD domain-containing protein [Bacteroidia bacterium]|nr:PKD domain-containing protein [Bacteroidia bacterium]